MWATLCVLYVSPRFIETCDCSELSDREAFVFLALFIIRKEDFQPQALETISSSLYAVLRFFFCQIVDHPKSNTYKSDEEKSVISLYFHFAAIQHCRGMHLHLHLRHAVTEDSLCYSGTTRFAVHLCVFQRKCFLKSVTSLIHLNAFYCEVVHLSTKKTTMNRIRFSNGKTRRDVAHEPDKWQPKG